jgi:hypothetical protein
MPSPMSDYDADEAALQRQTQAKKKKRRGNKVVSQYHFKNFPYQVVS